MAQMILMMSLLVGSAGVTCGRCGVASGFRVARECGGVGEAYDPVKGIVAVVVVERSWFGLW